MEKLLREQYEYVFEDKLLDEIIREGQFRKVDKDVCMIDKGDKITHMPLILTGAIKIVDEDVDGHEYLLYYLENGDSCAMTMTCCLGGKSSEIRAITEAPTLLYMIPVQRMEDWLVKYKSWRAFVFESYDSRMKEMLETIDSLAFYNLEQRLYKYLKDRAMVLKTPVLELTHSSYGVIHPSIDSIEQNTIAGYVCTREFEIDEHLFDLDNDGEPDDINNNGEIETDASIIGYLLSTKKELVNLDTNLY